MLRAVPFIALRTRILAVVVGCLSAACDRAPADLREWRPSDHDHTTNPGNDQVEGGPDAGTAPELAAHGLNEVVIVAWQQNCVRCHGKLGQGDGPQGAALRAPDFTNPAFQAALSDEQMLKSIRDGKGAMPPFPLPESTLKPLVQLIRLFGRASAETEAAAAAASASGLPAGRVRAPGSASGVRLGSAPPASNAALPHGHPVLPTDHPPLPTASAAPGATGTR